MKYVNEAFESSQGEVSSHYISPLDIIIICKYFAKSKLIFKNAEAPPTYSPTPAEGEEICSPTFPSNPPVQPSSGGGGGGGGDGGPHFSFDNNFVVLPSDPPPYTIQPTPAATTNSQ